MQTYDLIMIGVLVAAIAYGAWKGLAWQIASLASLVVSYFIALRVSPLLAPHLSKEAPLNRVLAMLVVYAASSAVIWLVFRMISGFINRLQLREFDRQMGALIGAAKGVLLCIAITFFAVSLTEEPTRKMILTSQSGHYLGYVLDQAPAVLPKEVNDFLGPYLKKLDDQLEHEHTNPQPASSPVRVEVPGG